MAAFPVDAAAAAGAGIAAARGPPAPAAGHPAYLSLARRALDPVAAPLLRDDGATLGALECFAAGDERAQQRSRAFVSLARVGTRRLHLGTVLLATFAFVYSLRKNRNN